MKLINFSVKNYRSITKAYKLPLDDVTVLVGPNNEGKSNVLKAINLTLTYFTNPRVWSARRRYARLRGRDYDSCQYDWRQDYPVKFQRSKPNGCSEFTAEFELSGADLVDFRRPEFNQEVPHVAG